MFSFGNILSFRRALIFLVCTAGALTLCQWFITTDFVEKRFSNYFSAPPPSEPSPPPQSTPSFSDLLFPVPPEGGPAPLLRENNLMLHSLFHCMEHGTCGENQTKVVILASNYFRDYFDGSRGGESIWATSVAHALENMGYTTITTPFPSLEHAQQYHNMFPDLVRAIFMDPGDVQRCAQDTTRCAHSNWNPTGIPLWKVLGFAFWPSPSHPLGVKWIVSPEDYAGWGVSDNTYLGYSIEDACRARPFIPHAQRGHNAYVLAKLLSFFTPRRDSAWNTSAFDAVTAATGVSFILGCRDDMKEGKWGSPELPSNHVNLGPIGPNRFRGTLSRTQVFIGLGNPTLSPSPYDALCLGVPFINPIMSWDREHPSDRSKWWTQHDGLRDLDPPYVYHVFKGDTDGLVQAVKDAVAHPIESYVPERMTMSALQQRLGAILERDWHAEALQLDDKQ